MRRALGFAAAAGLLLIGFFTAPAAAPAQSAREARDALDALNRPVTKQRAEAIASRDANVIEARREHPDLDTVSERRDGGDWQVGFVADGDEIVQVIVGDVTGEIRESWTGEQVAWRMARGYPGAFGRTLNAPWIWLPLCAIFVLGLVDWRRPLRWAHLDLLVIVGGFGISHFFFNRAEIGISVPLAYPPLLYLLTRTLWLGFRGGEGLRPSLPLAWLAVALLFLVGFRVGLNIADSNVIDVGLAGVIGADQIADGDPLYGAFPEPTPRGDTYGPAAYYSYVPFEQALPWNGHWGDVPAAHAAAIFFDLATIALLFVLGGRLRPGEAGRRLGVVLAFAWAACPYTAFALESNTNDALVAMLLTGALLALSSPPGRGVLLALASASKFAPLILAPLFATHPARGEPAWRPVLLFGLAFAATTAVVMAQTLFDVGLATFYERTIDFQAGRDSPFSIWGQTDTGWLQTVVTAGAGVLAVVVAFFPRRRDTVTVAALGAAVLIALQLGVDHWFYLYIPWFLPFLFVALAGRSAAPARAG